MDDIDRFRLTAELGRVFRPAAPINDLTLFHGRSDQVIDIIRAIQQPGQHVIIFGERGVGKTSIARILLSLLKQINVEVGGIEHVNCDHKDNFRTIWRKVFSRMEATVITRQSGFRAEHIESFRSLAELMSDPFGSDDVCYILSQLKEKPIIVIDELDQISDTSVLALLADTIKNLSDNSAPTTIILIGVGDSVDAIMSEHKSTERALVQIRMPRMSQMELREILVSAYSKVGITSETGVTERIVSLSQGLPHYTHALGLYTAERAVSAGSKHLDMSHLSVALDKIVLNSERLVQMYHLATDSPQSNSLFSTVLLACALTPKDDLGCFTASDVKEYLSYIMKRPISIQGYIRHLEQFCDEKRGAVLNKIGTSRSFRFRFANPLMPPYAIMHGLSKGLIEETDISFLT